jgi:lauroyl/myristoyl acyltransferase
MVPLALLHLGCEFTSIEPQHYLKKMGARGAERVRVLSLDQSTGFWLKELFLAKQLLESGGLLHWAVDGLLGTSGGGERSFHGRRRTFLRSFAELGVKTNAVLLPVFATVEETGAIQVALQPPLEPEQTAPGDQVAAIESVMTQYVEMLERQWLADPGNIVARHLLRFPEWPKIEPAP